MSSSESAIFKQINDYVLLDDQIAEAAAVLSALRKQHVEASRVIIQYLQEHEMERCATPTRNLLLRHETAQKSITMPLLREVFQRYFGNSARGEELLQFLQEYRKQDKASRWRLKRVHHRSETSA